jgi:uncharacterized RDD family membrane protein YckC
MVRDEQGYLTTTHVIRTPELVEFEFDLAGFTSRTLAWMLDCLIAMSIAMASIWAMSFVGKIFQGLANFIIFIAIFLVQWGYFTFFEWYGGGRTPGKRAMGLRVLQVTGTRIGFTQAALRNLLRAFDSLPFFYAVGGATALLAPSRRRLGDLVAGTMVVREKKQKVPSNLEGSTDAARPSSLLRLEERLRRASVAERELLLSAALRREELKMDARLALFGELARFVEERFGVEKPDHFSDEKLVLEAVSCLLRVEGASGKRLLV